MLNRPTKSGSRRSLNIDYDFNIHQTGSLHRYTYKLEASSVTLNGLICLQIYNVGQDKHYTEKSIFFTWMMHQIFMYSNKKILAAG